MKERGDWEDLDIRVKKYWNE